MCCDAVAAVAPGAVHVQVAADVGSATRARQLAALGHRRFRRRPSRSSGGMNGRLEPSIDVFFVRRGHERAVRPTEQAVAQDQAERRGPRLQLFGVAACAGVPDERGAGILGARHVQPHAAAFGRRFDAATASEPARRSRAAAGESRRAPRRAPSAAATASSDTSPISGAHRRRLPSGMRSSAGSPARRASRITFDASRCARPRGIRGPFKNVHCALKSSAAPLSG